MHSQNGFPRYPGSREELKAENKQLKRQLIRKGAQFGKCRFFNSDEGAEIENMILKHVLEYERQAANAKKIKLYEKIEKPTHFRPAASIPDHEINSALEEVISYLNKYSLDIDVCSPSVTDRELYRFAVEELFHLDIDDIHVPGLVTCFIYDEYHPDYEYENSVAATEYCMKNILDKAPMKWMHRFRDDNLWLNNHTALTIQEVRRKINKFKAAYDELQLRKLEKEKCVITDKTCVVSGTYAINAMEDREVYHLTGNWKIHFEPESGSRHWHIVGIEIEGIRF